MFLLYDSISQYCVVVVPNFVQHYETIMRKICTQPGLANRKDLSTIAGASSAYCYFDTHSHSHSID